MHNLGYLSRIALKNMELPIRIVRNCFVESIFYEVGRHLQNVAPPVPARITSRR